MLITKHENKPKPTSMTLNPDPMTIWLDAQTELQIERGDTLGEIAGIVREHWGLGYHAAHALVGYWFSIGERVHAGNPDKPWGKSELSADPERRYCAR